MATDTALEDARKQKIHNLKLKTACLENEEYIQELHVSDWSDTQRNLLNTAHQKAHELLADVEAGTRWNLTQAYDIQKLMRVCGLEMSLRELYKPDDKPHFMDILGLKKTLVELRSHRNKTRVVSFAGTIDSGIDKLEKIEEELRRSQVDATELAKVPVSVLKNLEDCMNVQNVAQALKGNEEQIAQQLLSIEKCKEIKAFALQDGEMSIAEDQFYIKAQLLERLAELVRDKFRIIGVTDEENRMFAKIHEVQKRAYQETSAMKDAKRKLKQRCETDIAHIQDAIHKADLEDAEAMRRYSAQKENSEKFLREHEDAQDECWRKIQDLERRLAKLGTERFEEVKRRIEEKDREEKRKVEYEQFLEVVGQHKKLLELTAYNCDLAVHAIQQIEELVAEGCTAIKARYDKTNAELAELRLKVHQEFLGVFRRQYKTLGILVYKKEKKLEDLDRRIRNAHIQLEFCIDTYDPNAKKHSEMKKELYQERTMVEEEIQMLKDKMASALDLFAPSETALRDAGVEFIHPAHEVEEGNLHRQSTMVEYRAHLSKQEEVRITAEREEIKKVQQLTSSQGTYMARTYGAIMPPPTEAPVASP